MLNTLLFLSKKYFYMLAKLFYIHYMEYYVAIKIMGRYILLYVISKRQYLKLLFMFALLLMPSGVLPHHFCELFTL